MPQPDSRSKSGTMQENRECRVMKNSEEAAMADDAARSRLGRGLAALMGDVGAETQVERARDAQPAQGADRARARQSAQSAQAVLRRRAERAVRLDQASAASSSRSWCARRGADNYEIIAGERRWRAAQRAGLHEVPIVALDVTDGEALELAIIENVQRSRSQSAGRGGRLSVARQRVQSLAGRHRQDRRQEPQPRRQHAAAAAICRSA